MRLPIKGNKRIDFISKALYISQVTFYYFWSYHRSSGYLHAAEWPDSWGYEREEVAEPGWSSTVHGGAGVRMRQRSQ